MKNWRLFRKIFALTALLALFVGPTANHNAATTQLRFNDRNFENNPFETDSPKHARSRTVAATQSDKRVTVTDIGPELGSSYAYEGFLINPPDPRQILVSSVQGGIFKSFDGGRSWSRKSFLTDDGFEDIGLSIRQDPNNPLTVYAVTNIGFRDSKLYRSTDFGETWISLPEEFFGFPSLADCAIHQASPDVIYLLPETGDSGVTLFRSTDGGINFEELSQNGLPEAVFDSETGQILANPLFSSMATTPADPNLIYVVNTHDLVNVSDLGGVYKSTDGGDSFARLENSPAIPRQVFPHPTQSNTFFLQAQQAGSLTDLYRTTDGGATFTEVTAGLPSGKFNFFVEFDPQNPSVVYVAGQGGLFRSTDGGNSFNALGLQRDQIGDGATTVSIDPTNSNVIYVNTDQGNFKSVNGGVSFVAINDGFQASIVSHLTFDNHSEPKLYVSTSLGNGVLKTQSRGAYYEQIAEQISPLNGTVSALAVDATDSNFIIVLTSNGIFRSTDGGHSWTEASTDTGQKRFSGGKIVIDSNNSNNVYVTCSSLPTPVSGPQFPGFYRSTDGGQTFTRSYHDPTSLNRSALRALAIDPSNPNIIYTASPVTLTGGTLLKSTDGGLSFNATQLGVAARTLDIALDPQNSNNIYLAGQFSLAPFTASRHILRSIDGGATFAPTDSGLSHTQFVKLIAIDPVNPSRLFVWTWRGLFMTTDSAASWNLLEDGEAFLRTGVGRSMAINPKNPNLLYLGGASVLEVEVKD